MPNCKVGDLVRFIAKPEREGFELARRAAMACAGMFSTVIASRADGFWLLDPPLTVPDSARAVVTMKIVAAHDSVLQPMRPGDGVDEMLRIAGRPCPVREELLAIRRELDEVQMQ